MVFLLTAFPALLLLKCLHMDYSTCMEEGGRREYRSCWCVWCGCARKGGERYCIWRGVSTATLSDRAKESIWWSCWESRLPLWDCVCVSRCIRNEFWCMVKNKICNWVAPKSFWAQQEDWNIMQIPFGALTSFSASSSTAADRGLASPFSPSLAVHS